MILYLLALLLMAYSFLNYKKSFLLYVIFQIFWYPNAEIISIKGLPVITINLLMNSFYALLYLTKRKKLKCKEQNPYLIPLLLIGFSYFITCIFAVSGFGKEIPRAIILILQDVVIVNVGWNVVDSDKDFKFIIKGSIITTFLAEIFGIVECMIKNNPIVLYKSDLAREAIILYNPNGIRGYRLMSFFEHPIGAGMTLALICALILCIYVNNKRFLPIKTIALITAILAVPCIVLTKMRSGLVFLIVLLLSLVKPKKKRFYIMVAGAVIFLIAGGSFFSQYSILLTSLINKAAQSEIGGSTGIMRAQQINAVLQLFKMSPIGGLGEKFSDYINNQYTIQALGYESVWFIQLVRHGIIGVIANIVLLVFSIVIIPRKYKSKELLFFSLAYWIVFTLTSIPSFRSLLYYIILFYFIKQSDVYKKGNTQQNNLINRI